MLEPYNLVKFAHVMLAIVAIGFNASYGIWLARAGREPQHLGHVLRGIKTLDDKFANPAYVLLLVTGILTALVGNVPFEAFWIAARAVGAGGGAGPRSPHWAGRAPERWPRTSRAPYRQVNLWLAQPAAHVAYAGPIVARAVIGM